MDLAEIPALVPDPTIRELLESAIAEYDRGELKGVAIVSDYQGAIGSTHCGNRLNLLAGASRLIHHLNQVIDEADG